VVSRERFRRLYLTVVSFVVELDAEYQRCLPHRLSCHHLLRTWSFFAGEVYLGLKPQMSRPAATAVLWVLGA
jgi:hypothetical protein